MCTVLLVVNSVTGFVNGWAPAEPARRMGSWWPAGGRLGRVLDQRAGVQRFGQPIRGSGEAWKIGGFSGWRLIS
ncbi:hypothetical protein PG995_004585 [Apiospora arundinis]